ncbi:MAG: copper amine oxidase N-terminal domain-containing protein [Ignavibacteriales bacterium]
MRKVIVSFTVLALILLSAPAALGAAATVNVDGKQVYFDVDPVNENGRLLVPMRQIFEALGAVISWDDKTQTVMAGKENTLITMKIGQIYAQINSVAIPLDTAPKLIRWRTMVPLRFVGEAFGATVNWNAQTKTVEITSPKPTTVVVTPPATGISDEIPADLQTALGSHFGSIASFSDYKFNVAEQENLVSVTIALNNADGIQKWNGITAESRRVFLTNIIDRLHIWYPEKVLTVLVRNTTFSEKSKADTGDELIGYNSETRLWKVRHVTQIGSASYFISPRLTDVNPFS